MHTSKSPMFSLSLALGLLLAAGCARTTTDTTRPEPAMIEPEPVVAAPAPEPTPEPTQTEPEAPVAVPLTDGEIVSIMKAMNDGKIEHATLAKTKARDQRVKSFATEMTKNHKDSNARTTALIRRTNLIEIDNEVTRKLQEETRSRTETLQEVGKGAEFDRAYMNSQVEMHTMTLDLLTNHMVPAAQNSDLRAEAEAQRAQTEAHLVRAREILDAISQPAA